MHLSNELPSGADVVGSKCKTNVSNCCFYKLTDPDNKDDGALMIPLSPSLSPVPLVHRLYWAKSCSSEGVFPSSSGLMPESAGVN